MLEFFLESLSNTLLFLFQICLWVIFVYYFVISIFGWVRRYEISPNEYPAKNKFAIVICAHNEELVIGGAVRSLKELKYPDEMYDIFVIADNCNDKTAEIAAENGANVYNRVDMIKKGKGNALEWFFDKMFFNNESTNDYTAICVLDADNLVSANYLRVMNKHLIQGEHVIQGYLDSKNPNDSWISANYSISYWISNRLFQLPRYYLGLSCALGGTGFIMTTEVLRKFGWGATCLTEDLEFSMKLVLKGLRVTWAHDAVVYDEKPLTFKQSFKQRKRWMQGHSDCAERYLKTLMNKAIKEKSFRAFDSALYLIQPFVIVANGIGFLLGVIYFFSTLNMENLSSPSNLLFVLLIIVLTYYNLIFVLVEGKLNRRIAYYFMLFPIYSLSWIPIILKGFVDRKDKNWAHTLHTRSLDIQDIEIEKVS